MLRLYWGAPKYFLLHLGVPCGAPEKFLCPWGAPCGIPENFFYHWGAPEVPYKSSSNSHFWVKKATKSRLADCNIPLGKDAPKTNIPLPLYTLSIMYLNGPI